MRLVPHERTSGPHDTRALVLALRRALAFMFVALDHLHELRRPGDLLSAHEVVALHQAEQARKHLEHAIAACMANEEDAADE